MQRTLAILGAGALAGATDSLRGRSLGGLQEYCPTADELNEFHETGNSVVHLVDGGWTTTGNARVSTKGVFNVLGGYYEFDMDLSRVKQGEQSGGQQGPNENAYVVFPQHGTGDYEVSQYCDNGRSSESDCDVPGNCCAEMDIIEANGNAAWATTWHAGYIWPTDYSTQYPDEQPCQQWGCRKNNFFDSASGECTENGQPVSGPINSRLPFKVRASFDASGAMTVTFSQGSAAVTVNPWDVLGDGKQPTAQTNAIIAGNMTEFGSVLVSSQWNGWVPLNTDSQQVYRCPAGANQLHESVYSVSNLRVRGVRMRGAASLCTGPAPSPPATPVAPPAPQPTASPSKGTCCYGGCASCGRASDYCQSQDRCEATTAQGGCDGSASGGAKPTWCVGN